MANGHGRAAPRFRTVRRLQATGQARHLVAGLLILVAVVGLRAGEPAVSWQGPLRNQGFELALVVEVILGILLIVSRWIDRRSPRPGHPAATIRILLRRAIAVSMLAVVFLVLCGLVGLPFDKTHLNPLLLYPQIKQPRKFRPLAKDPIFGGFSHQNLKYLGYLAVILIVLIPTLIVLNFFVVGRRRRRLRRGHAAEFYDEYTASLIEAVEVARRALYSVGDAQAAIIACYLAMEASLARAGTARNVAETPGEFLSRAQRAGRLRGPAAGTLTRLFYEARFSTHQLPQTARDDALQALDAISAELRSPAEDLTGAAAAPADLS